MLDADFLVGVQYGDEGKGKVSKALITEHKYKAVVKYNGGSNAGHAVWIGNKKYTAHSLTSAVYFPNVLSIVGPGCVVNVKKFLAEVEAFEKVFPWVRKNTFIARNVHIVTDAHIADDSNDVVIGTTKQGIGPAYADKYRRTGVRASDIPELEPFLIDTTTYMLDLMLNEEVNRVLMEGSQGWWLDIDHGDYPYVTSSHIHPAFALATMGLPLKVARYGNVIGVGKVYETYVGGSEKAVSADREDELLIRDLGKEYGETTGRPRKVGYLDLERLLIAVIQLGVDRLILNKMDILQGAELYKVWYEGKLNVFQTDTEFINFIRDPLEQRLIEVTISGDREKI